MTRSFSFINNSSSSRSSILLTAWALLLLLPHASAIFTQKLTQDGPTWDIKGYTGLTYTAIRYQPVCGNLGTGDKFAQPKDVGTNCTGALSSFKDTSDLVAVYDTSGAQQKDWQVGDGQETCLCFALAQVDTKVKGALCLWVDPTGRAEYIIPEKTSTEYVYTSNYVPVAKALPLCKDVNLFKIKASYSATTAPLPTSNSLFGDYASNSTSTQKGKVLSGGMIGGIVSAGLAFLIASIFICWCIGLVGGSTKVKKQTWSNHGGMRTEY